MATNVDDKVARGFGDEWSRFDQSELSDEEKQRIFREYFAVFPMDRLNASAVGADFGVGSGRWAAFIAPQVRELYCVDASSEALEVAKRALSRFQNCEFLRSSINDAPIPESSLDFGYSLGVLHHIPDTKSAMKYCVSRLKPGAPLLVYLYYRFDNKPIWYRYVWKISEVFRHAISRMPHGIRYWLCQGIALVVYWPAGAAARVAERLQADVSSFPLAYYRNKAFYVMRNDALDRFGTRLEQRFTRAEIQEMMEACGLSRIRFSEGAPFWCAVGFREG